MYSGVQVTYRSRVHRDGYSTQRHILHLDLFIVYMSTYTHTSYNFISLFLIYTVSYL